MTVIHTDHVVATFIPTTLSQAGHVVCACGWVSQRVPIELITATFHRHVHAAEEHPDA